MNPVLKVVHYVLVSVLAGGAGVPLLQGEGLNAVTLVAAVGALAVWLTKNTPKQPWARTLSGLYVAAASALAAAFTDQSISAVEWQQILLAALGAGAVLSAADETGPVSEPAGVHAAEGPFER